MLWVRGEISGEQNDAGVVVEPFLSALPQATSKVENEGPRA